VKCGAFLILQEFLPNIFREACGSVVHGLDRVHSPPLFTVEKKYSPVCDFGHSEQIAVAADVPPNFSPFVMRLSPGFGFRA